MTETELTRRVLELAAGLGVLAHHCTTSARCAGRPGLPDLILAGKDGVIFAELKSETGETSPEQDLWLWTLGESEQRIVTWRPSDLKDGRIRLALEAIA